MGCPLRPALLYGTGQGIPSFPLRRRPHFRAYNGDSAFPRVLAEIRLIIYKLLLLEHEDMILRIRTEVPYVYERRTQQTRRRSKFRYIADRMRSRRAESTYCLDRCPGYIYSAILGVNRQIHTEASHVLCSEHTFDFGTDIKSILPFYKTSRLPFSRPSSVHTLPSIYQRL